MHLSAELLCYDLLAEEPKQDKGAKWGGGTPGPNLLQPTEAATTLNKVNPEKG